jgi:hypothetical protein
MLLSALQTPHLMALLGFPVMAWGQASVKALAAHLLEIVGTAELAQHLQLAEMAIVTAALAVSGSGNSFYYQAFQSSNQLCWDAGIKENHGHKSNSCWAYSKLSAAGSGCHKGASRLRRYDWADR